VSWAFYGIGRAPELPPESEDVGWLAPGELARAESFGERRRRDFRLGRWVAKQALRAWLGPKVLPSSLDIEPDEDGAPRIVGGRGAAPCGLSLSHRQDRALCVLFPLELAAGCDLEWIEPRSDAFLEDFFTPDERARVAVEAGGRRWLVQNLIWSAKESCLKALHVGLGRDTRSIEVSLPELDLPPAGGWRPLSAVDREAVRESGEGRRGAPAFFGWWLERDGFVLTVLGRGGLDPPVAVQSQSGVPVPA
jgi:4'-phosphopantetheinyl transferase